MPRARRNRESSPPPAEEEVEEVEEQQDDEMDVDGTHALEFDEPLTWRAGKPIAVAELLRRLKTLHEELQHIQQEDAHRKSTEPKAQELASSQLLGHKDSGVKSWALLNIVEMFRILAPDAPFKPSQLKEIFTLFVSTIVPSLAQPSDPYNAQHLSILSSLTNVKSIILLGDVPGSDNLILNLFTNSFDVLSGNVRGANEDHISKNVEFNLTGMLCALIDECQSLPSGVIDILLAQFLRADPSVVSSKKGNTDQSLVTREVAPAYNMARAVCNTCSDKMIRHIGQYFNAVLIDATQAMSTTKSKKTKGKKRAADDSDDESDGGLLTPPSETDLEEVEKAHRLLRELWRSCPEVIRNVIPQIEAELVADNLPMRVMAVQTIGDMIAGIGAAGPPPPIPLEPAAYPPQSLDSTSTPVEQNVLLTPAAPHSFSSAYPSGYQAFHDRNRDKAPQVRSAWVTAAGRIILTSGGGKGLEKDQESSLLKCFSDMLLDNDEKVRLSAVQAVADFDFPSISQKLGSFGGATSEGSVLCNLVDRIRDGKPLVRTPAIELLGRIWGVAAGAIAEGSERARDLFGVIPSKILDASYVNDKNLNGLIQKVMWESLLPISFPPMKGKNASNGESQRIADSQSAEVKAFDPDKIRVERILVLVRDLGEKSKTVFTAFQSRQPGNARYMHMIVELAEKVKGAPGKESTKEATAQLETITRAVGGMLPDSALAMNHLDIFANHFDKRNFTLTRFCMNPESDYKKVVNAMKELAKRLEQHGGDVAQCVQTVIPFLRTCSVLVYNRSHVPPIMEISRTDDKGLGAAAHLILKEIAAKVPGIFKVHIKELCETLKKQAPTATTPNDPTAVDSLKACAGFARHFPDELGKDRDFYKAMVKFAQYGTPPRAAKHAVTVIVSSAQKKDMYIGEITKCVKEFKLGEDGSLSKLAALGQLRLMANEQTEDLHDEIMDIASEVIRTANAGIDDTNASWVEEADDDLTAKLLALKIVVNALRGRVSGVDSSESKEPDEEVKALWDKVSRLLNTLVEREGEISQAGESTPKPHRAQLSLAASKLTLKLCCNKILEKLFLPREFNRLTKIAQNPLSEVRAGFSVTLKKYLSQGKLPRRFYAFMFLYAFEPTKETKERTVTFLKSRANNYARANDPSMEGVLSHFISLLAHHPDFAADELDDFVDYIVFYLKIVATEKNLPTLYSVAQRLKTVQDAIDPEKSDNLWALSDLTEAIIRHFADFKGWSLQIQSMRPRLPAGLFAPMPSHTFAQEISEKRFLPDDFADSLEDAVKDKMRAKKRKRTDAASNQEAKKARTSTASTVKTEKPRKAPKKAKAPKPTKTPKKREDNVAPSSERRKSGRTSNAKSYAENEDTDDDDELEDWQEEDSDEEANKENEEMTSTPPTSDPTPLPAPAAKEKTPRKDKKKATPEKQKPASKKATKKLPARGGRTRNAKKERDVMSIPSDSDEELSDAPEEVEA